MNLVEVWFGIIERQAIRRGTFGSVRDLTTKIRGFIDGWNDRCHPFVWTKTADQILTKANRQKTSNTTTRIMILSTCRLSAPPEKVRFATRPKPATGMVIRALSVWVSAAWVTGELLAVPAVSERRRRSGGRG